VDDGGAGEGDLEDVLASLLDALLHGEAGFFALP